jgi:soluble lytic murein transglycosylase-like protein
MLRRLALRNIPLSLAAAAILLLAIPGTRATILNAAGRLIFSSPILRPVVYNSNIAPLFTPEIDFWSDNINRWAQQYGLDPNLLATVMQIESCGHPTISSSAGAQGLFQVMPFHFLSSENQLDPDTNAMRGAGVLQACLDMADGDVGLAMACYNGGPRVLSMPYDQWHNEPQRYYTWGTGIYGDAVSNSVSSDTLNRWLDAGGSALCEMAGDALGVE